jgi:hypothetical protein
MSKPSERKNASRQVPICVLRLNSASGIIAREPRRYSQYTKLMHRLSSLAHR